MTLPPDMLVEFFELLLERAHALRLRLDAQDHAGVRVLVHQVAGTGGAFGQPQLTTLGRALEARLIAEVPSDDQVREFATLCQSVAETELARLAAS